MKKWVIIIFLSVFSLGFSQQKTVKQVFLSNNEVEISALGLDTITILNSDSNQVEVSLFSEYANSEDLSITKEKEILKIEFKTPIIPINNGVFRKFITKRLYRSYAIVKIPQKKSVTIYGKNIDIVSKDYKGDLSIFIEKGDVKLQRVQGNVQIRLFQGNVFSELNQYNIDITTTNGMLILNSEKQTTPFIKSLQNTSKEFRVTSINANVFLNSQ